MKTIKYIIIAIIVSATTGLTAQASGASSDLLSKKLGLYVFPANEQTKEQQESDEYECYKWAVEQSGVDPLLPPKVEVEEVAGGPDGSAVRGAAGGAAKGALIGAVAGDAGKGAAIGATAGGIRGVGRGAANKQGAQQQAEANALATEQALMDSFMKAFSVCLEGKGYKVSR